MDEKNQEQNLIIGFDCHPDSFTAAGIIGSTPLNIKVAWIDNKLPITLLENWLKNRVKKHDLIIIEASGNTFNIVERIQKEGRCAVILESASANKVKKSYCSTDKTSAVSLARVYLTGLASVVWMPDQKTILRRELLYFYRNAVIESTRYKNRIYGYLNKHCLLSKVKKSAYNNPTTLNTILEAKDWSELQKELLHQMFLDLSYATEKRKKYRQMMAKDILNDPLAIQLVRIFGLRHINIFAIMAVVGNINRFTTPKKLVAYLGLNPVTNKSGKTDRSSGFSHHGRRDLRSLLTQSAQAVLNHPNNKLHKWAWKLVFRKGRNSATIAVARKIAVSIWYLLKGYFFTMEELPDGIKLKINRLVAEVDLSTIKTWGFETVQQCKEEKYNFLLKHT